MFYYARTTLIGLALCAQIGGSAKADLVIRLTNGGEAAIGVQFDGSFLSTAGPQNTPVHFDNFLGWVDDIPTASASFTLEGLAPSGPAALFDTLVIQQFMGGTFSLSHPDGTLLLSGSLAGPALAGTIGLEDGAMFTSSFSTVSGGTLAPNLDPGSLILQMHLSNINGGGGFSVGPTAPPLGGELHPFTAYATVDVEASAIPEPSACMLLWLAVTFGSFTWRRRSG